MLTIYRRAAVAGKFRKRLGLKTRGGTVTPRCFPLRFGNAATQHAHRAANQFRFVHAVYYTAIRSPLLDSRES